MDRAAPPRPTPAAKPPPPPPRPRPLGPSFARTLRTLVGPTIAAPPTRSGVASAPTGQLPATPEHARIPRRDPSDGRDPGGGREDKTESTLHEVDASDAVWSHRAGLVPPLGDVQSEARAHVEQVARHASVEELAPVLLRKMAWSGDGRRGAARLELGSGSLAGAIVSLEAEHGVVALSVEGLDAREESSLRARLARGLEARGFRLAP